MCKGKEIAEITRLARCVYGKGRSAIGIDLTLNSGVFDVRQLLGVNATDKDLGAVVVVKAANACDEEPPSVSRRCR